MSESPNKAERFKKFVRSEFKKSNVKSFAFFLVFSSLIWLIVQFSQQYTEIIKIPVLYENYPQDKLIDEKKGNLEIRVQQTGFQLAWFRFFGPNLKIDLSKLPSDSLNLHYNLIENHYDLAKKLPIDMNKAEFLDKEILVPFQLKTNKNVPVISNVEVKYAKGYSSENEFHIFPDTVQISGPKSALDSIHNVETVKKKYKDLNRSLLDEIELVSPLQGVNPTPERVNFKLDVEKFTENELEIPIEIVNAPANLEISLYPQNIKVKYQVSLKRYKQIDKRDFRIVVDYRELIEDQNFLLAKAIKQPEAIQNIVLSPKKVQYIIKKWN